MRVFVSGGTGEIGRPAVRSLVKAGHAVQVSSRSSENDELIVSLGAVPVRVDLLDADSVHAAAEDAEVIAHLATRIPPTSEMGASVSWVDNDRLRREGTAHLLAAARACKAKAFILQSYFAVHAPAGSSWIDDDPSEPAPPWSEMEIMASMKDAELEARALSATGTRVVILRFGSLYSETSEQLHAQVKALRSGTAAIPGEGDNYWPFIASEDGGMAVAHALDLASGTYHVCDDEPVQLKEFWEMAASALGLPTPNAGEPAWGLAADLMNGSWRLDNSIFRERTGWSPSIASVVVGWPQAVRRYLESDDEHFGEKHTVGVLSQ